MAGVTIHIPIDRRLIVAACLILVLAFVFVLIWPYLVAAGVLTVAWRIIARDLRKGRRRRPKSSWSSLGRTAALMYAAWNSRWLKPASVKASIPARADGGDPKPDAEASDDIPF